MNKKSNKKRIILLSVLAVIIAVFVFSAVYVSDYYKADVDAIAKTELAKGVVKNDNTEGINVYIPENATAGLIFYPGGKVEYSAYEILMYKCAENGILCVLVEMPFNLAVLDINAADGITEQYPEIEKWYIGGHSLGGSMAATYAFDNEDKFEGVILLGAYSTSNLAKTNLKVLSIYGSEDKVMNADKYEKYKSNLPKDYKEYVIDGGNHAYFGMYGEQDGDGKASITNFEQIKIAAEKITEMIQK